MNEIYLPRNYQDASMAVIVIRCLKFFGTEVGTYIDEKMRVSDGTDWLQELGVLRREYKLNLYDPIFVIKEALYSDSPLRKHFPKSEGFYRNLSKLKKLRNDVVHNNFDGNLIQTISSVELFFEVSMDIGISVCEKQFANLIIRLRDIEQGKTFDLDKKIQLEQAEKEKALSEERITELSEQIQEISKNSAILEDEIRRKEQEYQSHLHSLQGNDAELEKVKTLLVAKNIEIKELAKQSAKEKKRILEIKKEKEFYQEVAKLFAEIVIDDDKLQNFRLQIGDQTDKDHGLNSNKSGIGTVWTKDKGKLRITLSVRERDLIDPRTGLPISAIENSRRKELAEEWLKIRPSGGRIFVDEQGCACTLLNDNLIYLGIIAEFAAN